MALAMRRKAGDPPDQSGEWLKADLDAYCPNKKAVPILWGLAFAIGMGLLAHMIVRLAGWLGGR